MSHPVSDAAFELLGACKHSLRFAFGAPLDYPYAPAKLAVDNQPPALFRRLQAVSPPPARDGDPWQTGMTLDGRPFDPSDPDTCAGRLADVKHDEGAASLDTPDPEKIVLDRWFSVPKQPSKMSFPGGDEGRYLTSIAYWSPIPPSATEVSVGVEYYGSFRMDWVRPPRDRWVAVSLDAFWPAERDSADLIIPLGACDDQCPDA
jgi:hypothetical protein